MKKSECIRMAQIAVIDSNFIKAEDKLEILTVLDKQYELEVFIENKKEKNNG